MKKKKLKDIQKKIVITDTPELNIRILGQATKTHTSKGDGFRKRNRAIGYRALELRNFNQNT